jgi:hypothetical protein
MAAYHRTTHQREFQSSIITVRDAVIMIECFPNSLKIIELVHGEKLRTRTTPQEPDVVSELEEKYIFFADEADIARKLIRRGRSFALSVYFREP